MDEVSVSQIAKLLPVLIVAATLLAMVNARNTDLASRFRANVLEVRKTETSPRRRKSLYFQNVWFFARYGLTSGTFIVLAFSLACFAIYGLGKLPADGNDPLANIIDAPIGWIWPQSHYRDVFNLKTGFVSFLLGLTSLTLEFLIGFITLVMDGWSSLRRLQ